MGSDLSKSFYFLLQLYSCIVLLLNEWSFCWSVLLVYMRILCSSRVPPNSFSVKDVLKHVGSDRVVQVIDSATQTTRAWTMQRWAHYYATPKPLRKRVSFICQILHRLFFCMIYPRTRYCWVYRGCPRKLWDGRMHWLLSRNYETTGAICSFMC